MRGLQRLGEYLWEFFVVTAIAAVSAVTVLPFFPVTVGLADYFGKDFETRAFKDIFSAIAKNAKIIAAYTLFQLVAIVFPALNVFFFNTHSEASNAIVLGFFTANDTQGRYLTPLQIGMTNVLRTVRANGFSLAEADSLLKYTPRGAVFKLLTALFRGKCPQAIAEKLYLAVRKTYVTFSK